MNGEKNLEIILKAIEDDVTNRSDFNEEGYTVRIPRLVWESLPNTFLRPSKTLQTSRGPMMLGYHFGNFPEFVLYIYKSSIVINIETHEI